jgi:hypothetical protein
MLPAGARRMPNFPSFHHPWGRNHSLSFSINFSVAEGHGYIYPPVGARRTSAAETFPNRSSCVVRDGKFTNFLLEGPPSKQQQPADDTSCRRRSRSSRTARSPCSSGVLSQAPSRRRRSRFFQLSFSAGGKRGEKSANVRVHSHDRKKDKEKKTNPLSHATEKGLRLPLAFNPREASPLVLVGQFAVCLRNNWVWRRVVRREHELEGKNTQERKTFVAQPGIFF